MYSYCTKRELGSVVSLDDKFSGMFLASNGAEAGRYEADTDFG